MANPLLRADDWAARLEDVNDDLEAARRAKATPGQTLDVAALERYVRWIKEKMRYAP